MPLMVLMDLSNFNDLVVTLLTKVGKALIIAFKLNMVALLLLQIDE